MHQPRPRPAADQRLHAANAVVVDPDQDDVVGRRRRARGRRDAQVVGLELDGLDEREKAEGAGEQRRETADAQERVVIVSKTIRIPYTMSDTTQRTAWKRPPFCTERLGCAQTVFRLRMVDSFVRETVARCSMVVFP